MSSAARSDSAGISALPDLDCRANVELFVRRFYARMLRDPLLAPIFLEDIGIRIEEHLPRIRQYWEKMLLGTGGYSRHTMAIHRAVHARRALGEVEFARWLQLFRATLDEGFRGPGSDRARQLAERIARNMQSGLDAAGVQQR